MPKIILEDKDFSKLKDLDKDEYKEFLYNKIEECKRSPYYQRFMSVYNNLLDSFVICPPYNASGEKYEETEEQRQARLELGRELRNKQYEEHIDDIFDVDEYIHVTDAVKLLNISRKTITSILASCQDLRAYIHGKKVYINKESLKQYLYKRHYIGTELGMDEITKHFKKFKRLSKLSGEEKQKLIKELQQFVESEFFVNKWREYFEKVPRELRVFSEAARGNSGIDIFNTAEYVKYMPREYTIYNPNLKLVGKPLDDIPVLFPLKYVASLLGVRERTLLRYCEIGIAPHYKIGGKHMLSQEDINMTLVRIQQKNSNPTKKTNVGKKSSIENLFNDVDILKLDTARVFAKIVPSEYLQYEMNYKKLEYTKELINIEGEAGAKKYTGRLNALIRADKSLKRKLIKALISKEKDAFTFSPELLAQYNEVYKNYMNNLKTIETLKQSDCKEVIDTLEQTNKVLQEQINVLKYDILNNAIRHLNNKYK